MLGRRAFWLTVQALVAQTNVVASMLSGSYDAHDCLISAGYGWCAATESCVRVWETPCADYFDGCTDCLAKQRLGVNIACPAECDQMILAKPEAVDYLLAGLAAASDDEVVAGH